MSAPPNWYFNVMELNLGWQGQEEKYGAEHNQMHTGYRHIGIKVTFYSEQSSFHFFMVFSNVSTQIGP